MNPTETRQEALKHIGYTIQPVPTPPTVFKVEQGCKLMKRGEDITGWCMSPASAWDKAPSSLWLLPILLRELGKLPKFYLGFGVRDDGNGYIASLMRRHNGTHDIFGVGETPESAIEALFVQACTTGYIKGGEVVIDESPY